MRATNEHMVAEVKKAIAAFFAAWMLPLEEAIEGTMAYIPDQFAGIGTGPGDNYTDRDEFEALLRREKAGEIVAPTFEMPVLNIRVLRQGLALADGELRSAVYTEAQTFTIAPRFSMLLEKQEGRWLILHMHFSMADAMQEQGDTLMDALQRRNRLLEQEVLLRTAELEQSLADLQATQDQLVQQEKLASLGRLTAGIAHELKNPLNFITNFALLTRDLADELEESLHLGEGVEDVLSDLRLNTEKIEEHGKRADSIVKNMMAHARSGGHDRVPTDLNALVNEHIDLAYHGKRATSPGYTVTIERDLDEAVGMVELVPQDIGRVVLNLVSNAFDAVEGRQHALVTVLTARQGDQVVLAVEDNGPGIPDEIKAKVFEPFFTTKPAGQGTGLGLSLSYDIITQGHGGTMQVDSVLGKGAAFIITLPLTRAASTGN